MVIGTAVRWYHIILVAVLVLAGVHLRLLSYVRIHFVFVVYSSLSLTLFRVWHGNGTELST